MTAPSPVDVFKQAMAALQAGDLQALLELCTNDVVFEFPFAPPGRPGKVEGKRALAEYMAPLLARAAFDQFDLETHQTVDPDVAVIEMTATGRVTDTGEPFERPYVVVRGGLDQRADRGSSTLRPTSGPMPCSPSCSATSPATVRAGSHTSCSPSPGSTSSSTWCPRKAGPASRSVTGSAAWPSRSSSRTALPVPP